MLCIGCVGIRPLALGYGARTPQASLTKRASATKFRGPSDALPFSRGGPAPDKGEKEAFVAMGRKRGIALSNCRSGLVAP
jgi:hypothetical protein